MEALAGLAMALADGFGFPGFKGESWAPGTVKIVVSPVSKCEGPGAHAVIASLAPRLRPEHALLCYFVRNFASNSPPTASWRKWAIMLGRRLLRHRASEPNMQP